MTVKLSPTAVLTLVAGIGFLIFALSGRDLSPSRSVADSPHSTVSLASSDTAWQQNRSTIERPGPAQVTVIQAEGYGGSAEAESQATIEQQQVDADASETASGWRTPNPELVAAQDEKTGDSTNPHPGSATEAPAEAAEQAAQPRSYAITMEDGSVFDPSTYAPCTSDDGSGPRPCFWNAQEQGNDQGTSFFVAANGRVTTFG